MSDINAAAPTDAAPSSTEPSGPSAAGEQGNAVSSAPTAVSQTPSESSQPIPAPSSQSSSQPTSSGASTDLPNAAPIAGDTDATPAPSVDPARPVLAQIVTLLAKPPRKLPKDLNSPAVQIKQKSQGGQRRLTVLDLDAVWDEVQARNRAAGPWGIVVKLGKQQ